MSFNSLLLTVANGLNFISSIPLILAVIKDRNNLSGYSLFGSSITMISMYVIFVYLIRIWEPLSLLFFLPVLCYWTIVTIFLVKMRGSKESVKSG